MSVRLSLVVLCLLIGAQTGVGLPCARVRADSDRWARARIDALVAAAHAAYDSDAAEPAYQRTAQEIARTLEQCKLTEDEAFGARYREFVAYTALLALAAQPDHQLGFNATDEQYFAETRAYVQIPEFLLSPNFLRDVSRFETLERAKAYLRQLNSKRDADDQLIFFSYRSRHLGTPDNDNSFIRLLIVVPGHAERGEPEKWVQFGITDRGARTRVRNVSVVSAADAGDSAANFYFKDFYRSYRRDGSIPIKGRWELGYGDDNCAQCHKSGILPIFPDAGSVSAGEQWAVEAVNQRFLTYGAARFDKYLDASRLGPGLGAATRAERERRFGASFEQTKVARAMTCAACHTSARLGAFNWPMDRVVISSYIKGGQMPLGVALQAAERDALYERLIKEYFSIDEAAPGILKSWLLGRRRGS